MDYDKLLKEVEKAGDFADRDHARAAAEAVLSVLGDHLEGGSPAHLAAELPPELAAAVAPRGSAERFGVDEFDRRVAEREGRGCTLAQAHQHAAAVLTVVLASLDPGEAAKIAAQLPREFDDFIPPEALAARQARGRRGSRR
jgi:uncharacterized protein (DUF2267 family)